MNQRYNDSMAPPQRQIGPFALLLLPPPPSSPSIAKGIGPAHAYPSTPRPLGGKEHADSMTFTVMRTRAHWAITMMVTMIAKGRDGRRKVRDGSL